MARKVGTAAHVNAEMADTAQPTTATAFLAPTDSHDEPTGLSASRRRPRVDPLQIVPQIVRMSTNGTEWPITEEPDEIDPSFGFPESPSPRSRLGRTAPPAGITPRKGHGRSMTETIVDAAGRLFVRQSRRTNSDSAVELADTQTPAGGPSPAPSSATYLSDTLSADWQPASSPEPSPRPRSASPQLSVFGRRRARPAEPFVPINPFRFRERKAARESAARAPRPASSASSVDGASCLPLPTLHPGARHADSEQARAPGRLEEWKTCASTAQEFVTDRLPRQLYLVMLLWLPALYFSRVARVFADAKLSKPDVERMISACAEGDDGPDLAGPRTTPPKKRRTNSIPLPSPTDLSPPLESKTLERFQHSWELFVDTLLREWKTLNLVSALLCTAILTIFQIPAAVQDPYIRSAALFSLMFALMSLSYGCVYSIRFGAMRSMDRASRWAEEAQKTETAILWNIWVLLATPAVWLAWSMLSFFACILTFVWRTGSVADVAPPPMSVRTATVVRGAITGVFCAGMLYLGLAVWTFVCYSETRHADTPLWRRPSTTTPRASLDGSGTRWRRHALDDERKPEPLTGLGIRAIDDSRAGRP